MTLPPHAIEAQRLAEQMRGGDEPLPLFEVDDTQPRLGSLFSGYAGLDMAVTAALGGSVAWHCDIEAAPAKVVAHHHPGVPNLGDITAVDWADVAPVDVLTGGFPCQDVSSAGRRRGIRPGTRSGLWQHMAYAIDQLRPQLVVIENVRGLLSADAACDLEPCPWCLGDDEGRPLRALGAVLGDLADLGFDARWGGLRAADVGAPHGRYRIFITAWPTADTGSGGIPASGMEAGSRLVASVAGSSEPRSDRHGHHAAAAHATSDGRREGRAQPARLVGGPDAAVCGGQPAADADGIGPVRGGPARRRRGGPADHDLTAADADGVRLEGPESERIGLGQQSLDGHSGAPAAWGAYAPAIRRWELILGRPAPAPTQTGARGGQQLSPRFVEWMQGLPDGWVTGVPGISRNEQLKMLGNGVVPQQAEAALRWLLAASAAEVAA